MNKEIFGICVGVVAAIAAVIVVPEVREWSCTHLGRLCSGQPGKPSGEEKRAGELTQKAQQKIADMLEERLAQIERKARAAEAQRQKDEEERTKKQVETAAAARREEEAQKRCRRRLGCRKRLLYQLSLTHQRPRPTRHPRLRTSFHRQHSSSRVAGRFRVSMVVSRSRVLGVSIGLLIGLLRKRMSLDSRHALSTAMDMASGYRDNGIMGTQAPRVSSSKLR